MSTNSANRVRHQWDEIVARGVVTVFLFLIGLRVGDARLFEGTTLPLWRGIMYNCGGNVGLLLWPGDLLWLSVSLWFFCLYCSVVHVVCFVFGAVVSIGELIIWCFS